MARKQAEGLRLRYLRGLFDRRLPDRLSSVPRLRGLTGSGSRELAGYLEEVAPGTWLADHLAERSAEYLAEMEPPYATGTYEPHNRFLYGLVRSLRPELVVETGVSSGESSAHLLAALEANGRGRLVSIDLPFFGEPGLKLVPAVPGSEISIWDASPIPPGRESGWMVPDRLRGRWELRIGDARELLPQVLDELGPIDLFFHDSLHTREHMLFEYGCAWPYLRRGGVLVSDDVFRKHDALPSFARLVGERFDTWSGLGFIRKRRGEAAPAVATAAESAPTA